MAFEKAMFRHKYKPMPNYKSGLIFNIFSRANLSLTKPNSTQPILNFNYN